MSEPLNEEEVQRVALLVEMVMPTMVMLTDVLDDDDHDLFKRAIAQLGDEQGRIDSALPVFMAMGVDPSYSPEIAKAARMRPVMKKILELREAILEARRDEAAFNARMDQRALFKRMTGM